TDAIAGKPPPTGYAFSQSLSFWPPFLRASGLVYNDERSAWERSLTQHTPIADRVQDNAQ
ncbi:hypothetical protein V2I60_23500, partial [Pseudomonas viridiflava]|uniref:hypothetical protein n=1 Tax=Pseudomonas viridiflava TaxID=33069 RepID=UPI002EAE9F7D|nr:hypothetical protein [Pseudomonas viridiflava]